MLNGRYDDVPGEFTYMSAIGKSVVDYMITDTELHNLVDCFKVISRTESDHLPISCALNNLQHNHNPVLRKPDYVRYKWRDSVREDFNSRFVSDTAHNMKLKLMKLLNDNNINGAVESLVCLMQYVSDNMRFIKQQKTKLQPDWWDTECLQAKRLKYNKLNIYRKLRSNQSFYEYQETKKAFKKLCDQKEKEYKAGKRNDVIQNTNDKNHVWKCIKKLNISKGSTGQSGIDQKEWYLATF